MAKYIMFNTKMRTEAKSDFEKDLYKLIPTKWLKNAHNWLVLHGRYICKAKKPLCASCPLNHLCPKINAQL
jgi:endonuclease-3